jgi:hypothetical protein
MARQDQYVWQRMLPAARLDGGDPLPGRRYFTVPRTDRRICVYDDRVDIEMPREEADGDKRTRSMETT